MDEIFNETYRIQTKVTEQFDYFVFRTIQPFCENVIERRISKTELKEALTKQRPMTPTLLQDVTGIYASCPRCGNKVKAILADRMEVTSFPNYCSNCGQSLKWSNEA